MMFGLTVIALVIGLPWVILHYVTRWKTAATLTRDDEALLEELYLLARRLNERMDTVERLLAADHPEFHAASRLAPDRFASDIPDRGDIPEQHSASAQRAERTPL